MPCADKSHRELGTCALGPVDYVLVYPSHSRELETPRLLFEAEAEKAGLKLEREVWGSKTFLKVHCPFDRLAFEAERIKLEMPLKDCPISGNESTLFNGLLKLLTTDDEVDFVSAPFQILNMSSNDRLEVGKLHLYENHEHKELFFRSSLRSYLVYNILINLDIRDQWNAHRAKDGDDLISKRGLLYLLMKKAYSDSFVLHDVSGDDPYYTRLKENSLQEYYEKVPEISTDQRRYLNATWASFWRFQPLWRVRNYFGEKIAFYFAWEGTFITLLWIPAFLGLLIFGYGVYLSSRSNTFRSCVITPASNASNSTSALLPSTTSCTTVSRLKLIGQDLFAVIKEAFDNVYTPFFSLIICCWGTLFLELWKRTRYTLAYRWDVNNYAHSEPDRPEFFGTRQQPDPVTGELAWIYPFSSRARKSIVSFLVLSFMVLIVFVSVSAVIAYKVVVRRRFNCTVEAGSEETMDGDNVSLCLLSATVIPSLLNALSILLLGRVYAWVALRLTMWENHRTQSEYDNSLIIKLFAFQFANTYTSLFYIAFFRPEEHHWQDGGVFGWGEEYKDTCREGACMSLLSFQVFVLMLMKPFPKFFKDIVWPFGLRQLRRAKHHWRQRKNRQVRPESAGSTVSEKEKVPDFVQREYLKPRLDDFTMGEYTEKVIQFGYIVMFAASFPLAPFLALIINMFDLRVDAKRLLWWNRRPVSFIASDIGMWFHILRFVNFCGVISNAFIVGFTSSFCKTFYGDVFGAKCTKAERLTIVVVFEHCIFAAMYLVNVLVPDVPANIRLAQRRERYQINKILEEGVVPGAMKAKDRPDTGDSLAFPPLESLEVAPRREDGARETVQEEAMEDKEMETRAQDDRASTADVKDGENSIFSASKGSISSDRRIRPKISRGSRGQAADKDRLIGGSPSPTQETPI